MTQQSIMILPGHSGAIQPYEPIQSIRKHSRVAYVAMSILAVIFLLGAGVVPIGGAVIGADAGRGVIDTAHRLFGYDGLYVVDGSAVPSNPGVNP